MIAKAEWFTPRKFGWGLGIRKIEGLLYIAGAVAVVAAAGMLPSSLQPWAMGAIVAIFLADVLSVMPKVYSEIDEREKKHQLIAERNASFAGVVCLVGILIYASSQANQDMVIVSAIALVAMSVVKGITLLKLERDS